MTILQGRCEEQLKNIEAGSIDFAVFSPPYDKIRNYNSYELDLHLVGKELFNVMKDGSVTCVVIQDGTQNFAKSTTTAHLIVDWVDNVGFKLFETVIYQRDGREGGWWSKRFRVDHEYILVFFKGDRPKSFDKEHLKVPSKHAGKEWTGTQRLTDGTLIRKTGIVLSKKCRGTIWKYATSNSERNKLKLKHPATFPDLLAKDLILTFTKADDIVLDPMCGSGTSLRMAKETGRNYIGIEVSKEYIDIAKSLLEE